MPRVWIGSRVLSLQLWRAGVNALLSLLTANGKLAPMQQLHLLGERYSYDQDCRLAQRRRSCTNMDTDFVAHTQQGEANTEGLLVPQLLQQPRAHPSHCAPLEVNHPQQCHAIHSHLLLNMELIFHSGTYHTEGSFGKEKISIFIEAFHIDQKIFWYSETKQESR